MGNGIQNKMLNYFRRFLKCDYIYLYIQHSCTNVKRKFVIQIHGLQLLILVLILCKLLCFLMDPTTKNPSSKLLLWLIYNKVLIYSPLIS